MTAIEPGTSATRQRLLPGCLPSTSTVAASNISCVSRTCPKLVADRTAHTSPGHSFSVPGAPNPAVTARSQANSPRTAPAALTRSQVCNPHSISPTTTGAMRSSARGNTSVRNAACRDREQKGDGEPTRENQHRAAVRSKDRHCADQDRRDSTCGSPPATTRFHQRDARVKVNLPSVLCVSVAVACQVTV